MNFTSYNKKAIVGGIIAAVISGAGYFLLGNISGYKAMDLITSSLPGLNMLCNTVVLASATILALLLTLLGISTGSNSKLKKGHYRQVMFIARYDAITFVAAIIVFQLMNIPITKADNLATNWYDVIYWSSLVISSLLSGMLVSVVLMLLGTITNIIKIVGLDQDEHPLLYSEESSEDDDETPEKNK
ncbi:MAG: hypothetical protein WBG71_09460 [Leeuwenhoekiella sp.]